MTLSESTAIEAGIYAKLSLKKIGKKIQKSPRYVSLGIFQNRTTVICLHCLPAQQKMQGGQGIL